MEQVSTFGARLRALMTEQGETYLSLAQRLHMNPQTLNRYVLEQRSPKVTSAAAIAGAVCHACNTDFESLPIKPEHILFRKEVED